jgi:hypothetical protein
MLRREAVLTLLTRVSPAMVVAMLALLIAVGGSADAAKRLITGRDIKNASITGLDIRNKSLTAADIRGRLRGPRGPAGARGAQGPAGPQGAQGIQGIQGPPGTLSENLASGKTLSGNWVAGAVATGASGHAWGAIEFNPPLASAPTGHLLAPGAAPTADCPGSLAAPAAAAGHLCVYSQVGVNQLNRSLCNPIANACSSTLANRYGTVVDLTSAAAGTFYTWGTWAVTAP